MSLLRVLLPILSDDGSFGFSFRMKAEHDRARRGAGIFGRMDGTGLDHKAITRLIQRVRLSFLPVHDLTFDHIDKFLSGMRMWRQCGVRWQKDVGNNDLKSFCLRP